MISDPFPFSTTNLELFVDPKEEHTTCTQPDTAELPAAKIQKIGYVIYFFLGIIVILSCIMDAQASFGLLKT